MYMNVRISILEYLKLGKVFSIGKDQSLPTNKNERVKNLKIKEGRKKER